jgi:hypothetical protein
MNRSYAVVAMIGVAALCRVIPHPPNFAPITAMALFGGAYFGSRLLAFAVPLGALALSDLMLEALTRSGVYRALLGENQSASWLVTGGGFYSGWWGIYGAFVLIVGVGMLLRKHHSMVPVVGATLFSSCLFFLVTNFQVWAAGLTHPETALYPPTFGGLMMCYAAGTWFFNYTVIGDLFFVGVLFGSFALAQRRLPEIRRATVTA